MEPIPSTPPPVDQSPPISTPELSAEDKRTQQISTAMQTSSSVLKMIGAGISRIGREIAMMILRR